MNLHSLRIYGSIGIYFQPPSPPPSETPASLHRPPSLPPPSPQTYQVYKTTGPDPQFSPNGKYIAMSVGTNAYSCCAITDKRGAGPSLLRALSRIRPSQGPRPFCREAQARTFLTSALQVQVQQQSWRFMWFSYPLCVPTPLLLSPTPLLYPFPSPVPPQNTAS